MPQQFPSIIDADIYLFGLIFYVIFKNKKIDLEKWADIDKELKEKIEKLKKDKQHIKRPAALKYLNERIAASLGIFSKHIETT